MGTIRPNYWNWKRDYFELPADIANRKPPELIKDIIKDSVYKFAKAEYTQRDDGVAVITLPSDDVNEAGAALVTLISDKKLRLAGTFTISFDVVSVTSGKLVYLRDDAHGVSRIGYPVGERYEVSNDYRDGSNVGIHFAVTDISEMYARKSIRIEIKNIKMELVGTLEDPHATPYVEYDSAYNAWRKKLPKPHPDPEPEPEPEPDPEPKPEPIPKELVPVVEELNTLKWEELAKKHVKDSRFFYCVDPAGVIESEEEMYSKTQKEETITLATFNIRQERYGRLEDIKRADTREIPLAFFNYYRPDSYYILLQARIPMRKQSKDPIFPPAHELIASFFPLLMEHDPITITRQDYEFALNPINGSDVEVRLLTRAPQAWISILTYFEKRGGALSLRIIPVRNNKQISKYDNNWWAYRRASRYVLDGGYEYKIDPYLCTASGNGATIEDAEALKVLKDAYDNGGSANSQQELLDKLWSHPMQTLTLRGSDTAFLKSKTFKRDLMMPIHMMAVIDEALQALHIPYIEAKCENNAILDKEMHAVFELGGMEDTFTLYDLLSATLETLGRSIVICGDKVKLVPRRFTYNPQNAFEAMMFESLYQPITKKVFTTQLEVRPPLASFGWAFSFNSDEASFSYSPLTMRNERYLNGADAQDMRVEKYGTPAYDVYTQKQDKARKDANYNKTPHLRLLENGQLPPRLDRFLLDGELEGSGVSPLYGGGYSYVIDGDAAFQLTGRGAEFNRDFLINESQRLVYLDTRHLKTDKSYYNEMMCDLSFDCSVVPIEELTFDDTLDGKLKYELERNFADLMRHILLEMTLTFVINDNNTYDIAVELGDNASTTVTLKCIIPQSEIKDFCCIDLRGLKEKVDVGGKTSTGVYDIYDIKIKEVELPSGVRDRKVNDFIKTLALMHYSPDQSTSELQIAETLQRLLFEKLALYIKLSNVTLKASIPDRKKSWNFSENPIGGRPVSRFDRNYYGTPYVDGGSVSSSAKERVRNADYGGVWVSKTDNGDSEDLQLMAMPITEALMPTQNLFGVSLEDIKRNIEGKYSMLAGGVFAQSVMLIGTNGLPNAYYCTDYAERFNFGSDGGQPLIRFLSQCEYSLQLDITNGVVLTPMYTLEHKKSGILFAKQLNALDLKSEADIYTYVDSSAYDMFKGTAYYPEITNGKYMGKVESIIKEHFWLKSNSVSSSGYSRVTTGRRR